MLRGAPGCNELSCSNGSRFSTWDSSLACCATVLVAMHVHAGFLTLLHNSAAARGRKYTSMVIFAGSCRYSCQSGHD